MNQFWLSSGHLLTDRDASGRLIATPEFLKLYLARPELVPPPEACDAERALHAGLLADPMRPVAEEDLDRLSDPDARHNWQAMIAFRDRLTGAPSLEAAYLKLMREGVGRTPPLFITQLVHVILRNVLDSETDSTVLRAAELMFRPQRLTREAGGILLADEEVVDGAATEPHTSPLVAMLGENKARNLDVLNADNATGYFARSDAFDMVLDFRPEGAGRQALGRVIERWLAHMLGLAARVTPLAKIEAVGWFWFIGLDQEATRIGNALWRGEPLEQSARDRVVALYCLNLDDIPALEGRDIHLILAMTPDQIVRMKPQNLLLGLPDAALQAGGSRG